jgi:hypothetical protein
MPRKTKHHKKQVERQASRRLRPAPPKMAEVIRLANLLPFDFEPKDNSKGWSLYTRSIREVSDKVRSEELMRRSAQLLKESLDGSPKDFREYVWPKESELSIKVGDPRKHVEKALLALGSVLEARAILTVLTRISMDPADTVDLDDDLAPLWGEEGYRRTGVDLLGLVTIDQKGIISIRHRPVDDSLEGVELRRLRRCEICSRFFWAGKVTQRCCSSKCAHALRNRRYRARYKEYLIRQVEQEESNRKRVASQNAADQRGKKT